MSSRICSPGDTGAAQPHVWPQVGVEPAAASDQPSRDDITVLRAEWERQTEQRVREARQTGYQEGVASAQAAAAAEVKSAVERIGKTVVELAELRPRLRRQAEADLLELAFAIARRILHRELSVDAQALHGLIQAALEKLQADEISRVRVHPAHEDLVRAMLARSPQARHVELLADPALQRGAALFETARGKLDASVETQLREIEQGLTDRLHRP
jgi:flagellar assembly protein FliH